MNDNTDLHAVIVKMLRNTKRSGV